MIGKLVAWLKGWKLWVAVGVVVAALAKALHWALRRARRAEAGNELRDKQREAADKRAEDLAVHKDAIAAERTETATELAATTAPLNADLAAFDAAVHAAGDDERKAADAVTAELNEMIEAGDLPNEG